jgi:hypothetical protein
MEHVGKHLEKVGNGKEGGDVRQGDDELLVRWALREGIIEQGGNGELRLVGGNSGEQRRMSSSATARRRASGNVAAAADFDEEEEDAECEEE